MPTPSLAAQIDFNGTAAQTIPFTGSVKYNNLSIDNASASGATMGAAITTANVLGNLTVGNGANAALLDNGGFAIAGNGAKALSVANGATYRLTGTSAMASGFGTKTFADTSTVHYAGTAQSVGAESYGNLTLDVTQSTGSWSRNAAGDISVRGDWTINDGVFFASNFTVTLNGTAATQTIGGSASSVNSTRLTVNKPSGGVTIGMQVAVYDTLALTSGIITTGANTLFVGSSGTSNVTRGASSTSNFVYGNLVKQVSGIGTANQTFEVGVVGTTSESPVVLSFTSFSGGGAFRVAAVDGSHPDTVANVSGIDPAKGVKAYWVVTNQSGGVSWATASATFNFTAALIQAGADTSNFVVRQRANSSWTTQIVGTRTTASTQTTSITFFGLFEFRELAVGEPSNTVDRDQAITFGTLADKTYGEAPFSVTATASSGLTVTFSTTTPSVCTSGGTNGATITIVATGTCTVKADQAGNRTHNAAPSVSQSFTISPGLVSIAVSPASPTIAAGTDQPFSAIGTYSDATTADLTASVSWASGTTTTATIGATTGIAHGVSPGTSSISATLGLISGSTTLTVGPATGSSVRQELGCGSGWSLVGSGHVDAIGCADVVE